MNKNHFIPKLNYSDLILSDRFFHANSMKINGIVITVVAIRTG
jgi:hypothetical protein